MVNESIVGTRVTVSLGGTSDPAKQSSRLEGSYTTIKDSVPGGIKKSVGNRDLFFDGVLLVENGDIPRLFVANTTNSQGALPSQAVTITYTDGNGQSDTISGNGILTDLVISDEGDEAKATADVHIEFTGTVTAR